MAEKQPAAATLLASKTRYRTSAFRVSPREALHRAWRYSIFVTVMKSALPIFALGLGVAVLSYVLQPREQNRAVLTFENIGKVENDLAMVKPQLTGADKDGFPFTVTAATAVQEERGSDRVVLESVDARIALKAGGMLYLTAAHGIADTRKQLLDVSGGIHVTSDDGYEMRTESASADLKAGTIRGDKPIEASGKLGRVTARRFALDKASGQLRFSGNVRMVLNGAVPKPRGPFE